MGTRIEEMGNVYGRLTVIEEIADSRKGVHWRCLCECGNEATVSGIHLRCGNNKSCGCLNKLPDGTAAFNKRYASWRYDAQRRGYNWDLSRGQTREIAEKSCFYCGIEPTQGQKTDNNTGVWAYNGLDRIDNNKGYGYHNVVPCCGDCNWAKRARTFIEFRDWIFRVARHFEYGL